MVVGLLVCHLFCWCRFRRVSHYSVHSPYMGCDSMGTMVTVGWAWMQHFSGLLSKRSSSGGFLSCRRRSFLSGLVGGPCLDSWCRFVLGWIVGSCRSRAFRFECANLSVARGNRLFYSDLSYSLWSLLVSLLSWF